MCIQDTLYFLLCFFLFGLYAIIMFALHMLVTDNTLRKDINVDFTANIKYRRYNIVFQCYSLKVSHFANYDMQFMVVNQLMMNVLVNVSITNMQNQCLNEFLVKSHPNLHSQICFCENKNQNLKRVM